MTPTFLRTSKTWVALVAAAMLAFMLAGCGGSSIENSANGNAPIETPIGGDVIAPATMHVNELQGADVELLVGQVLNIDTVSLSVDSYTGQVADPTIAEFVKGKKSGGAEFNPGVTGLAPGVTKVTMRNDQGGIQPLEFTVRVTAR